jgi:hypothetical protein
MILRRPSVVLSFCPSVLLSSCECEVAARDRASRRIAGLNGAQARGGGEASGGIAVCSWRAIGGTAIANLRANRRGEAHQFSRVSRTTHVSRRGISMDLITQLLQFILNLLGIGGILG